MGANPAVGEMALWTGPTSANGGWQDPPPGCCEDWVAGGMPVCVCSAQARGQALQPRWGPPLLLAQLCSPGPLSLTLLAVTQAGLAVPFSSQV